jgi:hypothetical protein
MKLVVDLLLTQDSRSYGLIGRVQVSINIATLLNLFRN